MCRNVFKSITINTANVEIHTQVGSFYNEIDLEIK